MNKNTEEIKKWIDAGGKDFDVGFELFKSISRNPYFMANILRRRDLAKVKHELNKYYCQNTPAIKRKIVIPQAPHNDVLYETRTSEKDPVITVSQLKGGDKMNVSYSLPSTKGEGAKTDGIDKIILRKEFPFLGETDCPEEFKIMVADMITAHAKYVKAHDRLYDVANKDNEQCFKVASDLVENYIDNRDMWEELEHYKKTGKILGIHRIFAERKRRDEIMKMNFEELKMLRNNLQRRIWYRKKQITENPDDERILEWKKEIEGLEREKKISGAPKRKK